MELKNKKIKNILPPFEYFIIFICYLLWIELKISQTASIKIKRYGVCIVEGIEHMEYGDKSREPCPLTVLVVSFVFTDNNKRTRVMGTHNPYPVLK